MPKKRVADNSNLIKVAVCSQRVGEGLRRRACGGRRRRACGRRWCGEGALRARNPCPVTKSTCPVTKAFVNELSRTVNETTLHTTSPYTLKSNICSVFRRVSWCIFRLISLISNYIVNMPGHQVRTYHAIAASCYRAGHGTSDLSHRAWAWNFSLESPGMNTELCMRKSDSTRQRKSSLEVEFMPYDIANRQLIATDNALNRQKHVLQYSTSCRGTFSVLPAILTIFGLQTRIYAKFSPRIRRQVCSHFIVCYWGHVSVTLAELTNM